MDDNQRRHARYDTDLPVTVHGEEGARTGSLRNVSATGAAIEFAADLGRAALTLDIGDSVEVHPTGEASVKGTVVRRYDGGIGMQFDEQDDDLLERLIQIAREVSARHSG